MGPARSSLPAVLLLAALSLAVFAPVLGGERALLGVSTRQLEPWRGAAEPSELAALDAADHPLAADKTLMFHPQLELAARRLAAGEAPLWNPDTLGGQPLLAQAVHGVLHPPTLLAWALGLPAGYGWLAALQTFLAAAFTFGLLRALGTGRLAALLGGCAFGACGFLAARVHWYQIQGAAAYVPAVLWGVERTLRPARGRELPMAGTAAAVGLSFLAGFPQATLHALYAALAHAGLHAARTPRAAASVALALALGVLLGLPQMAPAVALAQSPASSRRAEDPELVASLGATPAALLALVVPDLYGDPRALAGHPAPELRERGALATLLLAPHANHVETAGWIGLATLVLAVHGALRSRPGRGLALGLAAAGLLLCLDSPLAALAARLPGLDTGDPRRFVLLFELGAALLAGFGLQRLIDEGPTRALDRLALVLAVLLGLGAVAAWALPEELWSATLVPALAAELGVPEPEVAARSSALAFDLELLRGSLARSAGLALAAWLLVRLARARRVPAAALLVALVAGDVGGLLAREVTALPARGFCDAPPGLAALAGGGQGRLARWLPDAAEARAALRWPLPPNTGLPFGIADLYGYSTLAPARLLVLLDALEPGSDVGVGATALSGEQALASPVLDALAADRVLTPREPDAGALARTGLLPLGPVGGAFLCRNPGAVPRARVVSRARYAASEDAALALMLDPAFDPLTSCVLETAPVPEEPAATAEVRFEQDDPELQVLRTATSAAAWLVVADTLMPGWTATIDGAPAPVVAADVAFRGLRVPAGEHVVSLRYDAPGWRLGLFGGGAGLVVLVVLLVAAWRRAQPRSSA